MKLDRFELDRICYTYDVMDDSRTMPESLAIHNAGHIRAHSSMGGVTVNHREGARRGGATQSSSYPLHGGGDGQLILGGHELGHTVVVGPKNQQQI